MNRLVASAALAATIGCSASSPATSNTTGGNGSPALPSSAGDDGSSGDSRTSSESPEFVELQRDRRHIENTTSMTRQQLIPLGKAIEADEDELRRIEREFDSELNRAGMKDPDRFLDNQSEYPRLKSLLVRMSHLRAAIETNKDKRASFLKELADADLVIWKLDRQLEEKKRRSFAVDLEKSVAATGAKLDATTSPEARQNVAIHADLIEAELRANKRFNSPASERPTGRARGKRQNRPSEAVGSFKRTPSIRWPTEAEWSEVEAESLVMGSSYLRCETKQWRSFFRIRCSDAVENLGRPTLAKVHRAQGTRVNVRVHDGFVDILLEFKEGVDVGAVVSWERGKHDLCLIWPRRAQRPKVAGVFFGAMTPLPEEYFPEACHEYEITGTRP